MESYNGWSAPPPSGIRPLVVDGASIAPGVRDDDDVFVILQYVAVEFDKRVEWLRPGWCWGFNYRATTGGTTLSNHASASAEDLNAPLHPYNVPASRNLTPAQIAEIHQILAELDGVVRWGGDYSSNVDAMHFELNVTPESGRVRAVADKIRSNNVALDQDDYAKIAKAIKDGVAAGLNPLKAAERERWTNEKKRDRAAAQRDRRQGVMLKEIAASLAGSMERTNLLRLADDQIVDADERLAALDAQDRQPVHEGH